MQWEGKATFSLLMCLPNNFVFKQTFFVQYIAALFNINITIFPLNFSLRNIFFNNEHMYIFWSTLMMMIIFWVLFPPPSPACWQAVRGAVWWPVWTTSPTLSFLTSLREWWVGRRKGQINWTCPDPSAGCGCPHNQESHRGKRRPGFSFPMNLIRIDYELVFVGGTLQDGLCSPVWSSSDLGLHLLAGNCSNLY